MDSGEVFAAVAVEAAGRLQRTRSELHPSCQRAVDDEVGAAHPAGHRAGDEDHWRGDLLRSAHWAGRVKTNCCLEEGGVAGFDAVQDPAMEVRVPGRDGVGANVLLRQMERETVDIADDRGLRSPIRARCEIGLAARDT